jgi:hypothetical protein
MDYTLGPVKKQAILLALYENPLLAAKLLPPAFFFVCISHTYAETIT